MLSIAKTTSVALLATATLVLAFPAMATFTSWSPPVTLSEPGQLAKDLDVVSSNGRAVVAWERNDGTDDIIQARTSLNGGDWSTTANLSLPLYNSGDVQLVANSNNLFMAVWEGDTGESDALTSVWASTSTNGLDWSEPTVISEPGQHAQDFQVSVSSSGLFVVVWARSDGRNTIVQSTTSSDGINWSAVQDVSAAGRSAYDPQVTISLSGLIVVGWERSDGATIRIQSRSSSDGINWSPVVNISGVGVNGVDVQLIVGPNGLFVAAWEQYSPGFGPRIIKTSSSSDGLIWSSPQDFSTIEESSRDVSFAVGSNGLFIAVWEMLTGGNDTIQSRSSSDGINWSEAQSLYAGGRSAVNPQLIANSDGSFFAVWEGDKSDLDRDNVIWWSSTSDGLNWSDSVPLYTSDISLNDQEPQLAADSTTGRVTAAWQRYDGTDDIIQAINIAFVSEQTPEPTTPAASTTPKLATTGANVEWLMVAGLISVIAGAGFLTVSRRKRTA